MKKALTLLAAAVVTGFVMTTASVAAPAGDLAIEIAPSADNQASPQMGDLLSYQTRITNTGTQPIGELITWLSIVRVDAGREAPVGLEDWSAEKATARSSLPGETIMTDWPMRLIQDGNYRVVVSAASRNGVDLAASPFADFAVRAKPAVQSARVLPVAVGVPLLLLMFFFYRRRTAQAR